MDRKLAKHRGPPRSTRSGDRESSWTWRAARGDDARWSVGDGATLAAPAMENRTEIQNELRNERAAVRNKWMGTPARRAVRTLRQHAPAIPRRHR